MDNIRNVAGCPAAGLTPHELFDASPIVREFTDTFLRNKAFTNLPRKFNVCDHRVHRALHARRVAGSRAGAGGRAHRRPRRHGFNMLVGGKMGSGGFQAARPLDVFVRPEEAAAVCAADHVHLSRSRIADGAQPRPAGVPDRRLGGRAIQARARAANRAAAATGRPRCAEDRGMSITSASSRQKQAGLNSVGLVVPVGPDHHRPALRAGANGRDVRER